MIDVHIVNKKKIEIFAEILCGRKLWKKKMINMHTVNKREKKKKTKIFADILCSEYMFIIK